MFCYVFLCSLRLKGGGNVMDDTPPYCYDCPGDVSLSLMIALSLPVRCLGDVTGLGAYQGLMGNSWLTLSGSHSE